MRLAVFSDVHGNLAGLQAVLAEIRKAGPDGLVFCGDICGYYYQQEDVIETLRSLPGLACVRGNHDQLFLDSLEDESLLKDCVARYGRSYELLARSISAESLRFLRSLPESIAAEDGSWAAFHGSPWDPLNEYVYPTDPLDKFRDLPHRFIFLGHTHHPMHRRAGDVHVINPGSCGQPRDYSRPSFALVDTEKAAVEFRRVQYDIQSLMREALERDPDRPYLSAVLQRERKPA